MQTASAICQVPLGFYGTIFKHLPLLGQSSLNSLNSNEHDKEVCIAGCFIFAKEALWRVSFRVNGTFKNLSQIFSRTQVSLRRS